MTLFSLRFRLLHMAALALTAFCSGCSHLTLASPLPDGLTVSRLGDHLASAPFAISPDSRLVAFCSDGLYLLDSVVGGSHRLSTTVPAMLSWSPGGGGLAVATAGSAETLLSIYSRTGDLLAERRVKAHLTDLGWVSDRDVAAVGLVTRAFTFGTSAATLLYRWDGSGEPVAITIRETTLRPDTARMAAGELPRVAAATFSPSGDELLYMHLHDPPMFSPQYKIMLRNLTSNVEREVATASLDAMPPLFAADGEKVPFGEFSYRWFDTGRKTLLRSLPVSGKVSAVSPVGGYQLVDRALYHNGSRLFALNGEVTGRFSADGGTLFLVADGSLYRVDGLQR